MFLTCVFVPELLKTTVNKESIFTILICNTPLFLKNILVSSKGTTGLTMKNGSLYTFEEATGITSVFYIFPGYSMPYQCHLCVTHDFVIHSFNSIIWKQF